MRRPLALLALLLLALAPLAISGAASMGLSEEAVRLRNLGLAELENEQPARAEEAFAKLVEVAPKAPLGYANLAIATLRQQKFEEARRWIATALEKAPEAPRLLAIQAEVEQWSGAPEAAVETLRRAAAKAPQDAEIQYSLYRLATTLPESLGEAPAGEAIERLRTLRPENLVVMIQLGQRSLAAGDRTGATGAFLRIRELSWQAPGAAEKMLEQVLGALEAADLEAARVPALRLENVLKITPMYRESLRELATGIQGVPVERFVDEPDSSPLGRAVPVTFRSSEIAPGAAAGAGLALGDLDGDQKSDVAWLRAGGSGTELEVRVSAEGAPASYPAVGIERLLAVDLDNDGRLDLLGLGARQTKLWRSGEAGLEESAASFGLEKASANAAVPIDFDIEGDLDLVLGGGTPGKGALELYRNSLSGPLLPVADRVFPPLSLDTIRGLAASDLDRDGDLDLGLAHDGGVAWLDNLRQGKFADRTTAGGLAGADPAAAIVSIDLDNDGWPDLVTAGNGLRFFHNLGGRFEPWAIGERFRTSAQLTSLLALDADNDGRADLAVAGPGSLVVLAQRDGLVFEFLPVTGAPSGIAALAAADLDHDGDLDLVTAGEKGLHRLDNEGGNRNHWLSVRLRGLDKGNSKNNLFGFGSLLEVRAGHGYQMREAVSDVTHFGLGSVKTADLLRVAWTNGVPQNRLDPPTDQWIVEEQLLKGSCPFLYVWDGERTRFVTDLLWGAPVGLPVAPGVWAGADPRELVRVDGARPDGAVYRLQITEELWEAAFFDYLRLWVVDHPAEVEVASSLKIVPGAIVPEEVHGTRQLRPVAAAWDAAGRPVTDRVAARDEVYADGWRPSRYQGVAAEPWSFSFDLGETPDGPVRLHLDGWIFPADASLNLAVAQRGDLGATPPRLEALTAQGPVVLLPVMGFPAGKTKTMVIDTPPLPPGVSRLRIVSSQWLSWDRIAWSTTPADEEPRIVARLAPTSAELRYRGFSAVERRAPNAPHTFSYDRVVSESPWLPFPGRYTRFGDVGELLAEPDDRSVILGPGDEMALAFDATALPALQPGWRRTVFLESHGWDKDADRNTWEARQVEPLPFRGMSGYPYGPREAFPDSPLHREYLDHWLTRVVAGDGRTTLVTSP